MSGVQFPPSPLQNADLKSAFFVMFYVYILQSRQNSSFYKGSTNDIQRRLKEHNGGNVPSTIRYLPWHLVWYAVKDDRSEALILERKLKNLSVKRTIELIKNILSIK